MPAEATVKRISQRRAEFALNALAGITKRDKFTQHVKGAPAMILQNGLGAALAFMLGKDDHKEVALAVLAWLRKAESVRGPADGSLAVIKAINNLSVGDYLRAQQEALEVLAWLKRYADAKLWS